MVSGVPRMCMATHPTPCAAATGHRLAETSFSRLAPAATAAWATAGFTVSTDTRTWPASASITGTTRRSSSASATGSAPGRLDSPPTSTRSAPSATISRPAGHGPVGVEVPTAVGEGVGRHVQDAHDQGPHAAVA